MLKAFCWIIMAVLCSCSDRFDRRLRILQRKFASDIDLLRDELIVEREKRENLETIMRGLKPSLEMESSAVISPNSEESKQRLEALEQHRSETERYFEEWKSYEQTKNTRISVLEETVADLQASNSNAERDVQALSIQLSHLQIALGQEKAQRNGIRHDLDRSLLESKEVKNRMTQLDNQLQELPSVQTHFRNSICEGVPESKAKDSCGNNTHQSTGMNLSCCIRSGFTMLGYTLGAEIAELKEDVKKSATREPGQVAFSAFLDHSITNIGDGDIIKFDIIEINDGNGYKHLNGKFTCKTPGVYVFTWSAMVKATWLKTGLIVNGRSIAKLHAEDYYVFDTGSNTVITRLNAGDIVWVAHFGGGDVFADSTKQTSFSGFLLY